EEPALLWPWQLACALLGLALAVSLYFLHRARRALAEYQLTETEEQFDDQEQGNPLADLQAACRTNRPAEARKALELWARQQHSEGLIGLSHNHLELEEALDDLNACLFGRARHQWRGKPLWRAVRMVIQSQRGEAEEESAPKQESLYPEARLPARVLYTRIADELGLVLPGHHRAVGAPAPGAATPSRIQKGAGPVRTEAVLLHVCPLGTSSTSSMSGFDQTTKRHPALAPCPTGKKNPPAANSRGIVWSMARSAADFLRADQEACQCRQQPQGA